MARWNAADGLVHFLFADEDQYILDSMIRLNLADYLYHELRRRGFGRIAFVDGRGGSYYVRVFNRPSLQWFQDQQKGLFGLGHKAQEYTPSRGGMRIACGAEQLRRMQKAADKAAAVWAAEAFYEVYGGRAEELEEQILNNRHRKNLIIVRSSTTAEDSFAFFTDPQGIFQASGSRGALFPEVVSAFMEDDPADEGCYVKFLRLLDDRGACLNQFTRQAVKRAVDCVVWTDRPGGETGAAADADLIASFIWRWYHDRKVQRKYPSVLSENLHHSYGLLCRDIRRQWPRLAEAAGEAGSGTGLFGQIKLAKPIRELGVISESLLVRYLPEPNPAAAESEDTKAASYEETNERLRETLRKPRKSLPAKEDEIVLRRFIDRMRTAMQKGDSATVSRVENCVVDMVTGGFGDGERAKLRRDYHEQLTAGSASLFDAENDVRQDEEKRDALWARARELHRRMKEEKDRKHLDETGEQLIKARIGSLGKQIRNYDLIINRKKEVGLDLANRIVQLEQAEEILRNQTTAEAVRAAVAVLGTLTEKIKQGVKLEKETKDADVPELNLEQLFEKEDAESLAAEPVPEQETAADPGALPEFPEDTSLWDEIRTSEKKDEKMSEELASFSFDDDSGSTAGGKPAAEQLKSILDNYY